VRADQVVHLPWIPQAPMI